MRKFAIVLYSFTYVFCPANQGRPNLKYNLHFIMQVKRLTELNSDLSLCLVLSCHMFEATVTM